MGQGDAILLRWNRRAILVDGGGPFDPMAVDFGRTRLVPKLLDRGVTRLDAVLATHPHPDHALGLFAVLEELDGRGALALDRRGRERSLCAARRRRRLARDPASGRSRPSTSGSAMARALTVLALRRPARRPTAINNQSVVALFERDGRSRPADGRRRRSLRGAISPTARRAGAGGRPEGRPSRQPDGHLARRSSTASRPRVALLSCGRRQPLRSSGARDARDARARSAFPSCGPTERSGRAGRAHSRRRRACGGGASRRRERSKRPTLLVVLGPTGAGQDATSPTRPRARRAARSSRPTRSRSIAEWTSERPSRRAQRRREVPYHLVDVAEPEEAFSAGRWAAAARDAVDDIERRGRAADRVRRQRLLRLGAPRRAAARATRGTSRCAKRSSSGRESRGTPPRTASSSATIPCRPPGSRPATSATPSGPSRSFS